MQQKTLLSAALAAIVGAGALGTAIAYAGRDADEQARASAALGAKTTLAQAVATAEAKGAGRALEAGIDDEDGKALYEVTTTGGNGAVTWRIDPASGAVVGSESDDGDDADEYAGLADSTTTLGAAILAAEQHTGARALEAQFEHDRSKLAIEVELTGADGSLHKVMIDPDTGAVHPLGAQDHDDGDDDGDHDRERDGEGRG